MPDHFRPRPKELQSLQVGPLVANPRTNTNKLSMCGEEDSGCQADGVEGAIEFLAQINVMSVQGVEDFGGTADRASHTPPTRV